MKNIDLSGTKEKITMMEFRNSPGEIMQRVSYGQEITITKNGKDVAVIMLPPTVINSDGTYVGEKPLTMGLNLRAG